jgi:hypothetical protein
MHIVKPQLSLQLGSITALPVPVGVAFKHTHPIPHSTLLERSGHALQVPKVQQQGELLSAMRSG